MLRPDWRCAATSCAITPVEKAGWSQSAMTAASNARENCRSVVTPARIDAAMPSPQAGFSVTITGSRASAGRICSACEPSTATTGQADDASAASTARRRSDLPSSSSSCFGEPIRVEAPAARITTPNRKEAGGGRRET